MSCGPPSSRLNLLKAVLPASADHRESVPAQGPHDPLPQVCGRRCHCFPFPQRLLPTQSQSARYSPAEPYEGMSTTHDVNSQRSQHMEKDRLESKRIIFSNSVALGRMFWVKETQRALKRDHEFFEGGNLALVPGTMSMLADIHLSGVDRHLSLLRAGHHAKLCPRSP